MKCSKTIVFAAMALTVLACSKDDAPKEEPTVNGAPNMATQFFTALENVSDTDIIGEVTAFDTDGDALTFSLATNDADLFEITESGAISLAAGKQLDYETAQNHSFTVSVTDGEAITNAQIHIKVDNVEELLADDPNAFVTTWQTEADGETITIYQNEGLDYEYTIEWGDGTTEQITTSEDIEHMYASAGTYTVAILGQFPTINMGEPEDVEITTLRSIDQWGNNAWETLKKAFQSCVNLEYKATDAPDLSKVTSMASMFEDCEAFNGDIGSWDVSNVEYMSSLFEDATSFNGDISQWDVSNVTDMSNMFAYNYSFERDLGGWNVGNVTDMSNMFYRALSFNQDISGWDVSNVKDMSGMFRVASSFNGDISNWNVGQVTNMRGMFEEAQAFNGDIGDWDVSNVTNVSSMFWQASSFNQDIGSWNVSSVTDMERMFQEAASFNQDITNWNVGNVEDMASMFAAAESFNQDLGNWNISKVRFMQYMLSSSGFSQENYSATLVGWANHTSPPQDIELGASGLTYCGPEAVGARAALENDHGWDITGDAICN